MKTTRTRRLSGILALGLGTLIWSSGASAAAVAEVEGNDTLATAQFIAAGSFTVAANGDLQDDSLPTASISGDIGLGDPAGANPNDVDFYCFEGQAGSPLYLDIDYGWNAGVDVDAMVSLFTSAGVLVAFDDDTPFSVGGGGSDVSFGLDPFIGTYTLPASGTYCAAVTAFANAPNGLLGAASAELDLGGDLIGGAAADTTFTNNGGSTGDYVLHISTGVREIPQIPTLSEWALLALAGLLGILGMTAIRRRITPAP